MLKELEALKKKQAQSSEQRFGQLAAQLMEASRTDQGAMKVYMEGVRNMDFDTKSRDASRFQDWRKNSKDMLDNKVFLVALRFHIRYLAISLMELSKPKPGDLPPLRELMDYVSDLVSARATGDGGQWRAEGIKELLEAPIANGKIAQGLMIQPELEKLSAKTGSGQKGWEPAAGGWVQILDTDIRAPLREKKDPRLLDTWQFQIKAASKLNEGNRSDVAKASFSQVEVPRLLWGSARDLIVLGQEDAAILQMTQLVRQYPQHPDLPSWIDELSGLLKKRTGPAAPAPAPAPAPGG